MFWIEKALLSTTMFWLKKLTFRPQVVVPLDNLRPIARGPFDVGPLVELAVRLQVVVVLHRGGPFS